jgi:hypothetical protein
MISAHALDGRFVRFSSGSTGLQGHFFVRSGSNLNRSLLIMLETAFSNRIGKFLAGTATLDLGGAFFRRYLNWPEVC